MSRQEMPFTYRTISVRSPQGPEDAVQVMGYEGQLRDLILPEVMGGLPVRSIAGHAFEHRKELRSVSLPQSLKTLRSFAFYGCTALSSMELYNTTDDYYDGVIRQCPSLHYVTVHCVIPDNYVIVREMLNDIDGVLCFRLRTPEGEIRLTFPEYVNEAKEDTMARAIHFSIEGAGMAYRECVGKRSLDLAGYDRLLGRLTDYDHDAAARIALGRLACPVNLSEKSAAGYEDFLRTNDVKVLTGLIRAAGDPERRENLAVLTSRGLIGRQALESGLEEASRAEETEICGLLMEYRRQAFPSGAFETLSLDW